MISIKKDFKHPPQLLVESQRNNHIKDALITKNKHNFNGSIYRDKTKSALKTLYKHKCAYCETDTTAGAPLQVEHFRPKAGIMGDSTHYGYYWIAYEWSNLTLGCSICNRKKGINFPIFGTRILEPQLGADGLPTSDYLSLNSAIMLNEQSVLLNPEIDKVEKHFYFLPNGEIKGVGERGEKTIEILDLNRQRLVLGRRKIWDDYANDIKVILKDFRTKKSNKVTFKTEIKRVFKKILFHKSPNNEYSRFGYFIFDKFEIFAANKFKDKQLEAILKFFELFKQGKL
jgi:uncharacterized protein (TIGR02646 family)